MPMNPSEFMYTYQKMNGKSDIITRKHSTTIIIKMKHHLVVTFGKLSKILDNINLFRN